MTTVAEKITRLRAAGYTIEEIAQLLAVCRRTVEYWLAGEVQISRPALRLLDTEIDKLAAKQARRKGKR